MVVGNMPEAVDFVVAGGGPGGYVAALAAARNGRKVTLVDADGEAGVGGVCLRVGCIPSKALIETADLMHRTNRGARQGVVATASFDAGA
jgi:dihydrolipoamide dehydrogenase